VSAALLSAIAAAVQQPAFALSTTNTALRFMHRVPKDATIFLLFNVSPAALNSELTLRAAGRTVGLGSGDGRRHPVVNVERGGDAQQARGVAAFCHGVQHPRCGGEPARATFFAVGKDVDGSGGVKPNHPWRHPRPRGSGRAAFRDKLCRPP